MARKKVRMEPERPQQRHQEAIDKYMEPKEISDLHREYVESSRHQYEEITLPDMAIFDSTVSEVELDSYEFGEEAQAHLARCIKKLTPRQQFIIKSFMEKRTQAWIAAELNCTQCVVSQAWHGTWSDGKKQGGILKVLRKAFDHKKHR